MSTTPIETIKGRIDCNQFVEIYKDVSTRSEIYFLMVRCANKDYLTCYDLQIFLETEQGVPFFWNFFPEFNFGLNLKIETFF